MNPHEKVQNLHVAGELTSTGWIDASSGDFDNLAVGSTATLQDADVAGTLDAQGTFQQRLVAQWAASSAVAQFSGIVTVASGDTTVIQSTSAVQSDSLIFLQKLPTIPASHIDLSLNVRSITDAGGFTVQVDKAVIDSQPISWFVVQQL